MSRAAVFIYGAIAYVLFLAVFLYAIGFVGNFGVRKAIDDGPAVPLTEALLVNTVLMGLFAVQHSVMARPGFKKWWTKIVPQPIERSTFVLLSNGVLALLFWQWRPITDVVWAIEGSVGRAIVYGLFILGFAVVVISTFVIDHFDLFGLKQVVLFARKKSYPEPRFQVTFFYRFVRHPLLLGFIIAFWAAPTMTAGHLLFAVVTTLYMLVAIQIEERDLERAHGPAYAEYRRQVPMIIPRLGAPAAPEVRESRA